MDKQILGIYNAGSYLTNTFFSKEEIRRSQPRKGKGYDLNYYYVFTTLLHEYYHHLQIIGTSFGRDYTQSIFGFGAMISKICKECFVNGVPEKFRRPFSFNELVNENERFYNALGVSGHIRLLLGIL